MIRERFRAMGTDVELLLAATPGEAASRALARARGEIARLEALLSRFRPDSELSRLNRARRLRVGGDLVEITRLALDMRRRTGGLFDPTVGRAVVAAGYDRSFDDVRDTDEDAGPAAPGGGGVEVEPDGWITLDEGVVLDLGAIAKGHAADRASAILAAAGPALANVGGDLAASGARGVEPWTVSLETLDGPITLSLPYGGLATSGVDRRRWRRGRALQHHVIDPRSGVPARTDLVRASAVASSAAEAEARATALLVAGDAAPALADGWATPAVLVPRSGATMLVGGVG